MMSTRTVGIVVVIAILTVGLAVFLTSSGDNANDKSDAPEIKWHGIEEGVTLARQENKKILVDVYTDWCVWCKKMDKEVYSDSAVGRTLATNFIGVKLNAESQKGVTFNGTPMSEADLAGSMGVTGYPTILFLDPASKPITKISGYMEPKEFTSVLRFIGEDHYKTQSLEEYKRSKRD